MGEGTMEESGKEHEKHGHDIECNDGDMACKATATFHGRTAKISKCFPGGKCKEENILKQLKADPHMPKPIKDSITLDCGGSTPGPTPAPARLWGRMVG